MHIFFSCSRNPGPPEMAALNAVDVRGLSRSFDGREILRDVTFSVGHGEIFGYLGPNGAGKTTTIRILLGLLTPHSGEVRVLGHDLALDDGARARVGVLFENNGLSDRLSAADNLAYYAGLYGLDEPRERIDELLALVDLDDRRNDPVGKFSTGMKRRLGIARAILHRPEVVFLDEPSLGALTRCDSGWSATVIVAAMSPIRSPSCHSVIAAGTPIAPSQRQPAGIEVNSSSRSGRPITASISRISSGVWGR